MTLMIAITSRSLAADDVVAQPSIVGLGGLILQHRRTIISHQLCHTLETVKIRTISFPSQNSRKKTQSVDSDVNLPIFITF